MILFHILSSAPFYEHSLSLKFYINKKIILDFLYVFIHRVFVNNILLWIISCVCLIVISLTKKNKETGHKICRYIIYSYLGFLIFCILTIFLGITYNYQIPSDIDKYQKYWINYPGILISVKLFLYVSIIYMAGYIESIYNKLNKILITGIIILSLYQYINVDKSYKIYPRAEKENAYINDKIAFYYLKKGQTAIISYETARALMTDNCIPPYKTPKVDSGNLLSQKKSLLEKENAAPENLSDNTSDNATGIRQKIIEKYNAIIKSSNIVINKLLKKIETIKSEKRIKKYGYEEKNPYILYLKKVYPIDITTDITYVQEKEEAIEIFNSNGGKIKADEVYKLKFSNITKE